MLGWEPADTVDLRAGWRLDSLDLASSDKIRRNEPDILLQGPRLELVVRF